MRILFLDTETGGLDEERHSLLTIGLVVWEDNTIIARKELWISKDNYQYDEEAMKINHINLDELREYGISELEAIHSINNFCNEYFNQHPVILAGHNIKFDIAFLKKLYLKYQIPFENYFSHKTIDTVSILKFLCIQGKIPKELESMNKMLEYYGIKVKKRHTALGDAELTAKLFTKLLEL